MPRQHARQMGDICYETGLRWRSIVHLVRQGNSVSGHRLREVRLKFDEDGVLVILKKDSPQGPMIAFCRGLDFDGALWVLHLSITSKTLSWKRDQFHASFIDKSKKSD